MQAKAESFERLRYHDNMAWYAHHVFATPTDDTLTAFAAHAALRRGLYLIEHLREFETTRQEVDAIRVTLEGPVTEYKTVTVGPRLPRGGLLVVRELCGPSSGAQEWFSPYDISWSGIEVAGPDEPLYDLRALAAKADAGSALIAPLSERPPAGFLRFLRATAESTRSVVTFLAKNTFGGDTEYAFGWVFDGKRGEHAVFVEATQDGVPGLLVHTQSGAPTGDGTDAPPALAPEFIVAGDALTHALLRHGLQISSGYFPLHTRSFPWERYRMKEGPKEGPRDPLARAAAEAPASPTSPDAGVSPVQTARLDQADQAAPAAQSAEQA